MRERSKSYRVLVGKPEEKRPLGRPRHICEHNIQIEREIIKSEGLDWINLARGGRTGGVV
jgi:hypothetical protein